MLAKVDRPLFVKVTRVLLQLGIHYVEVQSRFVCECERERFCVVRAVHKFDFNP